MTGLDGYNFIFKVYMFSKLPIFPLISKQANNLLILRSKLYKTINKYYSNYKYSIQSWN